MEISLYPLLASLEREGVTAVGEECRRLLREDASLGGLLAEADQYLASPLMAGFGNFAAWPMHNTREQAELMLDCSARLLAMNRDQKEIVCAVLSREVFSAVGKLMLDSVWEPDSPVFWLGHDIIARKLATLN